MFGPRLNTVFTSRWKALWWAAGILLTAYCTVPSPDDAPQPNAAAAPGSGSGSPADDAALRNLEQLTRELH